MGIVRVVDDKVMWLKAAISTWDGPKLQQFVQWITDAANLPDEQKITIRDAERLFVHTCFRILELSRNENVPGEDSCESFINMIEFEMKNNSYSAKLNGRQRFKRDQRKDARDSKDNREKGLFICPWSPCATLSTVALGIPRSATNLGICYNKSKFVAECGRDRTSSILSTSF